MSITPSVAVQLNSKAPTANIGKTNKSSAVAEMGDRLTTIGLVMGRKVGAAVSLLGEARAGPASNTMSPGPRPTPVPSGILIHPAV